MDESGISLSNLWVLFVFLGVVEKSLFFDVLRVRCKRLFDSSESWQSVTLTPELRLAVRHLHKRSLAHHLILPYQKPRVYRGIP